MKSFIVAALMIAVTATSASPDVQAGTITVAGVSLVLRPPPGYCALGPSSGDYERFVEQRTLLRPGAELVQVSVPCDELAAALAGKRKLYSRWALVQVRSPSGNIRRLTISRSAFITRLTKTSKRQPFDIATINRKIRKRLNGKPFRISASRIKLVGSDDSAAYVSMVGTARDRGASYVTVAFGAITLIKGLPIGVYAYAKHNAPFGAPPTKVAIDYLRNLLARN